MTSASLVAQAVKALAADLAARAVRVNMPVGARWVDATLVARRLQRLHDDVLAGKYDTVGSPEPAGRAARRPRNKERS